MDVNIVYGEPSPLGGFHLVIGCHPNSTGLDMTSTGIRDCDRSHLIFIGDKPIRTSIVNVISSLVCLIGIFQEADNMHASLLGYMGQGIYHGEKLRVSNVVTEGI